MVILSVSCLMKPVTSAPTVPPDSVLTLVASEPTAPPDSVLTLVEEDVEDKWQNTLQLAVSF